MRYRQYHDELLQMLEEDQAEIKASARANKHDPGAVRTEALKAQLSRNCLRRARRMTEILEVIKQPTIENVGTDGSQAISLIALHSKYGIMKQVLHVFQQSYKQNPRNAYNEAIPSLTDRVDILEKKKQKFGTQWIKGHDGEPFLYPVDDFARVNARRAVHGLSPVRYPRDLSNGIPKDPLPPFASDSAQREPTAEEYEDYSSEYRD